MFVVCGVNVMMIMPRNNVNEFVDYDGCLPIRPSEISCTMR